MAIQTANLGAPPSGVGGDTFRTAATKFNENFSNNEHAASRLVGTQAGNVMEVGAFGLGYRNDISANINNSLFFNEKGGVFGLCDMSAIVPTVQAGASVITVSAFSIVGSPWWQGAMNQLIMSWGQLYIRCADNAGGFSNPMLVLSQLNTTTDSNGFIKAASPIVKLFSDKIELNNEAQQQDIVFEKLGIGDYLIKGSTGFAQQGWYVETPKDANGNSLVAVVYEQLENQDISVKTYKKKFDIETSSIVADLEQAIDIPVGRWIDIRLQELPQPEFVPPVSNTPASFQPTGISQAVSEMMNGTEQ